MWEYPTALDCHREAAIHLDENYIPWPFVEVSGYTLSTIELVQLISIQTIIHDEFDRLINESQE